MHTNFISTSTRINKISCYNIDKEQALAIRGGAFLQSKDPTYTALLRGVSGTVISIVYLLFIPVNFLFQLQVLI